MAHLGVLVLMLGVGACMDDQSGGSYSSPSHWPDSRLVLPAGTSLRIRLASRLHAQIAGPGDSWTGTLIDPVVDSGRVLLPAGTHVHGNVIDARKPGRAGGAMLDLAVSSVSVGGEDVRLYASADEVLADAKGGASPLAVTAATADPRTPLVLPPGTEMTFTIEESVAVRYTP